MSHVICILVENILGLHTSYIIYHIWCRTANILGGGRYKKKSSPLKLDTYFWGPIELTLKKVQLKFTLDQIVYNCHPKFHPTFITIHICSQMSSLLFSILSLSPIPARILRIQLWENKESEAKQFLRQLIKQIIQDLKFISW